MRPVDVVGVVGPHLETAGGDDQPLAGELGADRGPPARAGPAAGSSSGSSVGYGAQPCWMNALKASEKGVWRFGRAG